MQDRKKGPNCTLFISLPILHRIYVTVIWWYAIESRALMPNRNSRKHSPTCIEYTAKLSATGYFRSISSRKESVETTVSWRHFSWFCHSRILDIPINRNIPGLCNRIIDYMATFFDFNYIAVTIPNSVAWAGGKSPRDGLAIYTDESITDEGQLQRFSCGDISSEEGRPNG